MKAKTLYEESFKLGAIDKINNARSFYSPSNFI